MRSVCLFMLNLRLELGFSSYIHEFSVGFLALIGISELVKRSFKVSRMLLKTFISKVRVLVLAYLPDFYRFLILYQLKNIYLSLFIYKVNSFKVISLFRIPNLSYRKAQKPNLMSPKLKFSHLVLREPNYMECEM